MARGLISMSGTSAYVAKQFLEGPAFLLLFCLDVAQPLTAAQARLCFRATRSDQSHKSPETRLIVLTCSSTGGKAARAAQTGTHS